jgi:hypothetical protein
MVKIIIKESIGKGPNDGVDFLNKKAKKIAARGHDVKGLKFLGAGLHGYAYEMSNGRVFKLTDDVSEAMASRVIMGKKTTYIANIYDVFKFKGTDMFGIVQEKLTPPSSQEKTFWDEMSDLNVVHLALIDGFGPWSQVSQQIKDTISDAAPEDENLHLTPTERKNILINLKKYNFPQMIDELYKFGIKFDDFHGENIMKRGNTSVIIDLGYSEVQNPEDVQVIENKK